MKLLKLVSYLCLPFGVLSFLAVSIWIHQTCSIVPHPERGMTVPIAEHSSYLYVTPLMYDLFYAAIIVLGLGIVATITLGLLKPRER